MSHLHLKMQHDTPSACGDATNYFSIKTEFVPPRFSFKEVVGEDNDSVTLSSCFCETWQCQLHHVTTWDIPVEGKLHAQHGAGGE